MTLTPWQQAKLLFKGAFQLLNCLLSHFSLTYGFLKFIFLSLCYFRIQYGMVKKAWLNVKEIKSIFTTIEEFRGLIYQEISSPEFKSNVINQNRKGCGAKRVRVDSKRKLRIFILQQWDDISVSSTWPFCDVIPQQQAIFLSNGAFLGEFQGSYVF